MMPVVHEYEYGYECEYEYECEYGYECWYKYGHEYGYEYFVGATSIVRYTTDVCPSTVHTNKAPHICTQNDTRRPCECRR